MAQVEFRGTRGLSSRRASADMQLSLDIAPDSEIFERYTRLDDVDGVPAYQIDIPETIPQLGYGTHQFFRYYGKFPSILGKEIIAKWGKPGANVLDCYAGSGTTLVEAQIQGCSSFGIDINPLAVFSSNVKTRRYDVAELYDGYRQLKALLPKQLDCASLPKERVGFTEKWFSEEVVDELARLRSGLLLLEPGPVRDFLTLTFLSIVRRTSKAYDGEVRPHINPNKRPRRPLQAIEKKFVDMIQGLRELDGLRSRHAPSHSIVGDNRDGSTYDFLGDESVQLVVAHPPYLNSFNYLAVYNLELFWSQGFEEVWQGWNLKRIKAAEHKAWPATDERITANYYEDFASTMRAATHRLVSGGMLAVVVGDATIRGRLEPVHTVAHDIIVQLGLEPVELWYRTTHYGIGKYAYSHRADYHGEAEKKDAIMHFRQP